MIEGKVVGFQCRVEDKGQKRGWDLMTTYYLWNSTILPNFEQIELSNYQLRLTEFIELSNQD